jgi:hypothetical protein
MSHVDLQPGHGPLLGLIPRCPPGLQRIDAAITRLVGAAKGEVAGATLFLPNPTWDGLCLQTPGVRTGLVLASREAPP